MDINTSLGAGYGNLPKPGAGYAATAGDDEDALGAAESSRFVPSSIILDKVSGGKPMPIRQVTDRSAPPRNPALARWLTIGSWLHRGAWAVSGLCLFAFTVIVSTPILVPLITFGNCFTGGFAEWLEFTTVALRMSATPGLVAAGSAVTAVGLDRGCKELKRRGEHDPKQGSEMRIIEEMMKSAS